MANGIQISDDVLGNVVEKSVSLLKKHNLTISMAESCTGGFLAKLITDVSGASNVFEGSFVSYSNEFKKNIINVNENLIKKYGVISKECSENMARETLKLVKSDIAVSVTGVAGPSKQEKKSVGLVYFSFAFSLNAVQHLNMTKEIYNFKLLLDSINGRNNIRKSASYEIYKRLNSFL